MVDAPAELRVATRIDRPARRRFLTTAGADASFGQCQAGRAAWLIRPMPYPIVCVECASAAAEFERGWRGYLTDDENEPAEVAILCPECAEPEFGPLRHRTDETNG